MSIAKKKKQKKKKTVDILRILNLCFLTAILKWVFTLLYFVPLLLPDAAFFENEPWYIHYIPKYHDNVYYVWQNITAICYLPSNVWVRCDRCAINVRGNSGFCLNGKYTVCFIRNCFDAVSSISFIPVYRPKKETSDFQMNFSCFKTNVRKMFSICIDL